MKSALREAGLLTYQFGPFRLIPERLLLVRDGRPVEVGPKALELLVILVERAGQVVSKRELMERLWPDTFVEDNNLAQAVSSLRQALADDSDSPQYVKTIPRRGYTFTYPVRETWDGALAGSKKTVVPALTRIPSGTSAQPRAQEQPPIDHLGSKFRFLTLRYPRVALLIAAAVLIISALFLAFGSSAFRLHGVKTRSAIAAPPDWEFVTTGEMAGSLILSPDGANAAFGARNAKSQSMLFLRKIDSLAAEPIAGTEGAAMPFWSPDGSKIGFFANQQLKTLYLADRSVHVVCGLQNESFRGGTWETPDTILLADSTRGPILKVSASGGSPTPVTDLAQSHFTTHRWPQSLPDGNHFLFLAADHDQGSSSRPAILVGSLDGAPPRFVVESDSNALFVAGQLLFVSGGKLLAQPFDPNTGKVGTAARILADTVEYDRGQWHAAFAATPQLLVYRQRPKTPEAQVITLLDNSGEVVKTVGRPGNFQGASVSPDGKAIASMCDDLVHNICVIHPDGTLTQVNEIPINYRPIWSPDGSSLAYGTHRGAKRFGLAVKNLKAQNPEQVLMESDNSVEATSWSPDQKELLVEYVNADNHSELGTLRLEDGSYRKFLSAKLNLAAGKFSPDGKWVAYQSDESGQDQVYIASFPDPSQKYVVSRGGGQAPRWGRNNRDLYFLDASDMIYLVRIETGVTGLKVREPKPLFRPEILPPPFDSGSFDVSGSEPLFVVVGNASKNDAEYILVTSWTP